MALASPLPEIPSAFRAGPMLRLAVLGGLRGAALADIVQVLALRSGDRCRFKFSVAVATVAAAAVAVVAAAVVAVIVTIIGRVAVGAVKGAGA